MRRAILALLGLLYPFLTCCFYNPLKEPKFRVAQIKEAPSPAFKQLKVTFLGNSTIHLWDGETSLLVDGFVSRPGIARTLFSLPIRPDEKEIRKQFKKAKITKVDAILIGHTHADHSLDAPAISELYGAQVYGTTDYEHIHSVFNGPPRLYNKIPDDGGSARVGKFFIRFLPSEHIKPIRCAQKKIDGRITQPLKKPVRFNDLKCGKTFAIHISHPEGNIAITTSAGAKNGQWQGLTSDVLFLGVGLLGHLEHYGKQRGWPSTFESYWQDGVAPLNPDMIVASHWDLFTVSLDLPLIPVPYPVDHLKSTMRFLESRSRTRQLRAMDKFENIYLRDNKIIQPKPKAF